jgi:hypothetical protein
LKQRQVGSEEFLKPEFNSVRGELVQGWGIGERSNLSFIDHLSDFSEYDQSTRQRNVFVFLKQNTVNRCDEFCIQSQSEIQNRGPIFKNAERLNNEKSKQEIEQANENAKQYYPFEKLTHRRRSSDVTI